MTTEPKNKEAKNERLKTEAKTEVKTEANNEMLMTRVANNTVVKSMRTAPLSLLALLVLGLCLVVPAQSNAQTDSQNNTQTDASSQSTSSTSSQNQNTQTTPAPAFGQTAPVLNPENPPISGLDQPGLELHSATRSFISPALQVSESADTNGQNQLGGNDLSAVTRLLGALDLQQFWQKSDLFLEYLGGGAFYSNPYHVKQLEAVGLEGVTRWRTGRATIRDAFSYLPDGTFSIGTFGGVPGFGIANGGVGSGEIGGGVPGAHLFGDGQLGSVGDVPRLANTAILDVVQAINPISALTLAGGFSNAHFYDNTDTLLNSDQTTAQAGYSRLLNRHDQIGLIYAFQLFRFPQVTGGEIYNDIINIRYSHTINGRMSLLVGFGPQYTDLQQGTEIKHWDISGRAQFRYKFQHSSIVATYVKFTSAGSGFFPGADTQAARFAYKRPLGRTWDFFGDLGYSHNKKIQPGGIAANSYNEGFASAIFRKHFGRTYDFFLAYRFSEVAFDVPTCVVNGCGRIDSRHLGTIGVEWHPTPTRIE